MNKSRANSICPCMEKDHLTYIHRWMDRSSDNRNLWLRDGWLRLGGATKETYGRILVIEGLLSPNWTLSAHHRCLSMPKYRTIQHAEKRDTFLLAQKNKNRLSSTTTCRTAENFQRLAGVNISQGPFLSGIQHKRYLIVVIPAKLGGGRESGTIQSSTVDVKWIGQVLQSHLYIVYSSYFYI